MTDAFKPGLYRHFKGGHYYAMCVAHSHDDKPDDLKSPEVVYYSYDKRHWRRRPLASPEDLPDQDRCGWLDIVQRESYTGPRFKLIEPVEAYQAMRSSSNIPVIPIGDGELITMGQPAERSDFERLLVTDEILNRCQELEGQTLTASCIRQKLYAVVPQNATVVLNPEHNTVMLERPSSCDHRYGKACLTHFRRGNDYPTVEHYR